MYRGNFPCNRRMHSDYGVRSILWLSHLPSSIFLLLDQRPPPILHLRNPTCTASLVLRCDLLSLEYLFLAPMSMCGPRCLSETGILNEEGYVLFHTFRTNRSMILLVQYVAEHNLIFRMSVKFGPGDAWRNSRLAMRPEPGAV
jgi:hypothetical protein